jgi:hypothetical protein
VQRFPQLGNKADTVGLITGSCLEIFLWYYIQDLCKGSERNEMWNSAAESSIQVSPANIGQHLWSLVFAAYDTGLPNCIRSMLGPPRLYKTGLRRLEVWPGEVRDV